MTCPLVMLGLFTFAFIAPLAQEQSMMAAVVASQSKVLLPRAQSIVVASTAVASYEPGLEDLVKPAGLPELGKWMISPSLQPADWLGATYESKSLKEPINVVILDQGATSAADAKLRLIEAFASAGYPSRTGHSGGYAGYIAGKLYPQLPTAPDHAFSDGIFLLDNNHGRIFGPYPYSGGYLFIGAMSREKVDPIAKVKHQYASFNQARDDLAKNLSEKTSYRTVRFLELENALVDNSNVTTGDHDGVAAFIVADE